MIRTEAWYRESDERSLYRALENWDRFRREEDWVEISRWWGRVPEDKRREIANVLVKSIQEDFEKALGPKWGVFLETHTEFDPQIILEYSSETYETRVILDCWFVRHLSRNGKDMGGILLPWIMSPELWAVRLPEEPFGYSETIEGPKLGSSTLRFDAIVKALKDWEKKHP